MYYVGGSKEEAEQGAYCFIHQLLFVSVGSNAQTSTATQGNHHIKRLDTFAVDSKPTLRRPYLWFAERHLLAGFANTLDRSLCNCKFVTVGDRIFLESTKPLLAGMEVIAFYERSD